MVKFSKELEAQLIPEWKEAFVNYWQLKKCVKKIKLSRKPKQTHDYPNGAGDCARSIYYPIKSLTRKIIDRFYCCLADNGSRTEIIQVKRKAGDDGETDDEVYETELAHLFSQEHEVKEFFEKLDEELNKVNQFYKAKEAEFIERAENLNQQLAILLDLKKVWSQRQQRSSSFDSNNGTPYSLSSPCRSSNCSDNPEEFVEIYTGASNKETSLDLEKADSESMVNIASPRSRIPKKVKDSKVGKWIDISTSTSTRAIASITSMLREDLLASNPRKGGPKDFISKRKIDCAEKMIRGAFVELYRGLNLLKRYSSLNLMAFTKILKKFDKVANQQASTEYLIVVKRSYFASSDKVFKLMDEVESLFALRFTKNDRKKAMKFLRPHHGKESHMVTFFVGLFTGSFVTLFSLYIVLAHVTGIFSTTTNLSYVEIVYPVFSAFALLSLHLFMYGCNLYMWKRARINHNFIFEFTSNTALKYRDAFLICTTFMTVVVGAMTIHLLLRANHFLNYKVDAVPGILLLIFVVLLICPFDILYRPTRYCFLRVMRNIVCSPFYKVVLVDLFMADQLTSQIPLLRHMETTACYFIEGSFRTYGYEICRSGRLYWEFAYVISFLPYYWRAMQCARKWYDEGDVIQLANMGKYVSAMVAAGVRITYSREPNYLWFGIVLFTSVVATIYQLYWDFVMDWGLLNPKSKNPWLRDDLILKTKGIYYFSMALNVVLRVAWVETVMRFNVGVVRSHLLDFFLACLEVMRRGHWNFYRLEKEHLNNAGKFRAVKMVPIPFREMDTDG